MYLTRMALDAGKRKTMIALTAPSLFHGAVESAFAGGRERRLWRIDRLAGRSYLMIVSENKPELASAAQQFGDPLLPVEICDYTPLLDRITVGSQWQFRLCANPTYCSASAKTSPEQRGRVCAHTTTEHQRQWLCEQAEKHGFTVEADDFEIREKKWYSFAKGKTKQRRITLLAVTFEGLLTVTEPALFRQALTEGIGRSKAYGMGMITVMRRPGGGHA